MPSITVSLPKTSRGSKKPSQLINKYKQSAIEAVKKQQQDKIEDMMWKSIDFRLERAQINQSALPNVTAR